MTEVQSALRAPALWLSLVAAVAPAASLARADDAPKLAGTWKWEWKDAEEKTHKHVLEVEGAGAKLAARERFDDMPAIKVTDLKLDGKAISFTVQRGYGRSEYKGTVADADTINGTVTVSVNNQPNQFGWTAAREKPSKP